MSEYMQRWNLIDRTKMINGDFSVTLRLDDYRWLMSSSEAFSKIADEWLRIEEIGTKEDADDFYSFVQDVLTGDEEDIF